MSQISSIDEANNVLAQYIPRVREMLGKDLTLVRMTPMMQALGNPQDKLKIIHVAGTSGKTSTAYYIASLLKTAGKRVGHTVSPHIDTLTERVQVDLNPISDEEFCASLEEFLDIIETVEPKPTYFELIIAYVYWFFDKVNVDYAVIETGLGGTFDATNIATSPDKVCVITDIGMDHMHVLGNTLREIAGQKAGIIHNGNQVFTYHQSSEIMDVFKTVATSKNVILNVLSNNYVSRGVDLYQYNQLPEFQKRNWTLAHAVYEHITSRDLLPALSNEQLEQSMSINIPARLDIVKIADKTIIMDGAHNQQKMTAFVDSYQKLYPHAKANILLSLKQGKEHRDVLPLLKPICNNLIITTFTSRQDLPAVSISPELLAKSARNFGFKNVEIIPDAESAYNKLLSLEGDISIITGSFYLISNLRPIILSS